MNRKLLFCHKCGIEIRDGLEYCEVCGTPVQESVKAAHLKRVDTYFGAIQQPEAHTKSHTYTQHPACQQNPVYNPNTPNAYEPIIAELSKKIDVLQANQSYIMQNTEKILKKYAKSRSACIAVLSIFLGILILACVILTIVLIFMSSDTVKTIVNIIDEIYGLLVNYEGQLNRLMDVVSGMIG